MKGYNLKTLILLAMLLPSLVFAQQHLANETLINSDRSMLESSLKFKAMAADSFEFDYEKSPGRAFLMSAILPGAGELYAGAKWRAAAFASVEVLSWTMYFVKKNLGEDIEKKYINFADAYWNLQRYIDNISLSEKYFGLKNASHTIFGSWKVGDVYYEIPINNSTYNAVIRKNGIFSSGNLELYLADSLGQGVLSPVNTRDYYENIGKYDQYACGWEGYFDYHINNYDTLLMTPDRDNYLTKRKDSNDALKMATNFATVIMFNHLISAFHAQIAAKNYSSEEAGKVSWYVGLVTDVRYKNPVRGLSLSIAF